MLSGQREHLLEVCSTRTSFELTLNKHFGKWPAGTSPREVGTRLAEDFVLRKFDFDANHDADT